MKKIKYCICFVIIAIISTIFNMNLFALQKVPNDVIDASKSSMVNFIHSIEEQKEMFGLTSQDEVEKNTYLGEGYVCYMFSPEVIKNIKSNNIKLSIKDTLQPSGSYIFPIMVGKKNIGFALADIDKKDNMLKIVSVSYMPEFENYINVSKEHVKNEARLKNIEDDGNINFLYDMPSGLMALSMKKADGDFIVPINDNMNFNVKKNENKPLPDIAKEASYHYKSKPSQGDAFVGGDASQNNSTNIYPYIVLFIIACLVIAYTIFFRKSDLKSNI